MRRLWFVIGLMLLTPPVWAAYESIQKAEDSAHTNGQGVVPIACRRADVQGSSATASGNWATVDCDAQGRVRVAPNFVTPNGDTMVDDVTDAVRVTGVTVQAVSGNVAHDSPESQAPVVIGGHATASVVGETPVAGGDAVRWHFGTDGVPIVRQECSPGDVVHSYVELTGGTGAIGIAAQGVGIKVILYQVVVANTGSLGGNVRFTDGSTGPIKLRIPTPALNGGNYSFALPISFSANTDVYLTPSSTDTIGVTMVGCKSKL